jgi:hypothetical protein
LGKFVRLAGMSLQDRLALVGEILCSVKRLSTS